MQFNNVFFLLAAAGSVANASPAQPATEFNIDEFGSEELASRGSNPAGKILCGDHFGKETPDKLRALTNDMPFRGQACRGPGECGHIFCDNTSTDWKAQCIGMCNTNKGGKCVDKIDVCTRALEIIEHCKKKTVLRNGAGQGFYPDGTNVIVHGH